MFRGNSYIDAPHFNDTKAKPGYNHLRYDVSDINGADRSGNQKGSPNHIKQKGYNK